MVWSYTYLPVLVIASRNTTAICLLINFYICNVGTFTGFIMGTCSSFTEDILLLTISKPAKPLLYERFSVAATPTTTTTMHAFIHPLLLFTSPLTNNAPWWYSPCCLFTPSPWQLLCLRLFGWGVGVGGVGAGVWECVRCLPTLAVCTLATDREQSDMQTEQLLALLAVQSG